MLWNIELFITLALVCVLLFRLYAIFYYKVHNWSDEKLDTELEIDKTLKVLTVIPMLREQSNLPNLYESIVKNTEDIIVFVTTAREEAEKLQNKYLLLDLAKEINNSTSFHSILSKFEVLFPKNILLKNYQKFLGQKVGKIHKALLLEYSNIDSTSQVLQRLIATTDKNISNKIYHLHYKDPEGIMAHQLNYAIDEICNRGIEFNYVCLLTADSHIDVNFFNAFKTHASSLIKETGEKPPVIQAISYYGKNFESVNGSCIEKIILRAAGNFQTSFSVFNELLSAIRTEKHVLKNNSYKVLFNALPALTGHGCFIREDIFKKYGGFPTDGWCEDIILTCVYGGNKIPILPLRGSIEVNEIPVTLKSLLKQMMMWANTGIEISIFPFSFLKKIRQNDKTPSAFLFFVNAYLKRIVLNFAWGILPVLTLYFLFIGHYLPVFIVLFNLVLMGVFGRYVLKKKCHVKQSFLDVIIGIILFYFFVYPAGFFLAVISKAVHPIYKFNKPSTER